MRYFVPPIKGVYIHFEQPLKNEERHSSFPYLSGDTFRSLAQFYVDELQIPFDPDAVQKGDIVFVKARLINYFFEILHPLIKNRYILISHNCDDSAPGKYLKMLDDDKLIAWFAQNSDLKVHQKLFPIPIGIANMYWPHGDIKILNSAILRAKDIEKKHLLYVNILSQTNPAVRQEVEQLFLGKEFCYSALRKPWEEYLLDLAESKFVLCPRGAGEDTHRTWEVLLMNSIPIVKSSPLDSMYTDLPVVIVNNWNEITQDFLESRYDDMQSKKYNRNKLYASYWFDMISQVRMKALA